MSPRQLVVFLFAALALCLASPLLAVWPMPQYSTYPCAPGTVSPAENCTNQGGNPNLLWQVKLSDRTVQYPTTFSCTPVSGQFGGFCDGPGCTSQAGFCRQPAILAAPTYEIVTDKDGLKVHFHVEYDFPGNYCQISPDGNMAEWPIVFNNYHLNRLQILDASGSNVLAETMAVFEHGQWNPLLPLCGSGTYQIRVLNECAGAQQTATVNVAFPSTVALTACQADRSCEWCDLSHGGPSMPGHPGAPIHLGSGDVTVPLPLFAISQDPMPLSFGLEYHSQLAGNQQLINEPMGRGWTHNFNQSLRAVGTFDNDLYMLRPDGSEAWYRQTSATTWVSHTPGNLRETISLINGQLKVTDLDGRVTAFDAASGNWSSTSDRWGNTISGTYNAAGKLAAITDSEGRSVQLAYTGSLLTQVTLPDSQSWRFGYAGGELTQIFDPMHTATAPWRTFEYTADTRGTVRLLTAVRDEAGALLEGHAYDALERGITSFREGNRDLVSIAYDGPNPTHAIVTTAIDGTRSQTATFTLMYQRGRFLPTDVAGDCASCGGGDDHQSFSFDNSNYPTSRTDGDGNLTQYAYDANGNVTSRIEAAGTQRSRSTTFTYGYAPWPRFVTQMTASSAAVPGSSRNRIAAWSNNEQTLTVTETGWLHASDGAATSYTTTTTFDGRHRLVSADGPRTDIADVTTRAYFPDADANANRRGRLQSVTTATGLTTSFDNYDVYGTTGLTIDPNGVQNVTETDARGRAVSVTNKAVASDARETTDYTSTQTYDGRDRLTRSTRPQGNSTGFFYEDGTNRLTDTIRVDAGGNQLERRHVTLNVIGDRVREEDQACSTPAAPCASWITKRQEDFVYDLHNRLAQVLHTIPAGASIVYAYDPAGLLQSVKDENHATPNTTYGYDELQRLASVTQTLNGGSIVTRYGYDVQDNLTTVTDPNGNTTTYAYDDFRRMQSQTSPVTGTTAYTYDAAGNLTSSTDANAATTARTYDADNRLRTATATNAASSETVKWTWDDGATGNYGKGRLASMSDPTGSMTYAYERRGLPRLEQHTIQNNPYSISYGYDPNGNRTSITYPSGRAVTYAFDFADRPLSASSGGTAIVSNAAYLPFGPETQLSFGNGTTSTATFDSRYMPVDRRLARSGATLAGYTYTHDAAGNITSIHDVVDPTYNRDFAYDDLNRLAGANSGGSLWGSGTFAYDAMGNMTSQALGTSRQSSFAYSGALPKLTNVTENGSTRAVAYDAAGNEQTVGASSFVYSPRNQLASGDGLAYTYDGRGLRTVTTVTAALGTFSGTVVAAATGTPIAGAIVTVDDTLNGTSSDAYGNFTLNQPSGNFTLTVTKIGYLPQTTTAFTLTAGGTVPVGTVMLSVAPSTITGSVVSSLGGPVAGATIALSGSTATASTDSSGRFSITQPAGTFTATVSAGGYQSQSIASFTTQPGLPYSLGTITLTVIPATVSGTVLSSTGGAVAGATVTASSSGAAAVRRASATQSTTTDASGNFQFSLGPGSYTFTIAKSGFGTATTSLINVGPGSTFSIGTIVIDPLGTITGKVIAQATGSPVVNATVAVSGSINTTSTDATGHFSLQQPPGTYAIRVSASGFAEATTPFFTIAPGATYDAGTIQLNAVALTVNVGYADDLRASSNFPIPWAGAPNVIYIGTPSPLDAGAIRLDNSTDAPMPIDNVTVDLGRPGPTFNLWGSFVVPAHGSVILTQTAQFNFDTSDYPIVACGAALVPGDPRVPRVLVTNGGGATTTYYDTGHILDTGGYDLACSGNESLAWRPIGTTGIGSNGDFLLGPPTGTAVLGTPYVVTASVTDANGNPQPNITVAFRVIQGPNSGATGSATTDVSGHASFTYTGSIAGTDTIQATITNASGGTSTSNPVTVNWPAFTNVEVFVGYADDLRAGAAFPNPWQGSPGIVFIGNRGGAWDSGAVRIDNMGDTPLPIENVTVDLQRPGPSFSLWGSFTIPAHQSAILAQTYGENFDTSDSPIVGCGGTLSPTERRIPKITIRIAGQSASYLDTSHILDTFGYDLVCRANESLQWRPVGSSSTVAAGNLALRPLTATTVVGGTYTASAIATDAGNEPVPNITVNFLVPTGPNSGRSGQATTNASGIATFSYASTTTGSDTVRASITNSVGAVLTSNDVTSAWVATASLELSPASTTTAIGSVYNATARVTDGSGNPLSNLIVTFRITSGPNVGKTGQAITDSTGHATFTYFSSVSGTDNLVASVIGSGGNAVLSNQVDAIWIEPLQITLAPSSATTPIGANYTATAFVASGNSPSAGAQVTFTVLTGPNAGRTQTSPTDGTGHATFTYTSSVTGTDVIEAATGSLKSSQVISKWVAIPTTLAYTGTLAGEYSDPLTLAARLSEAITGNPIAGQIIAFQFGAQTLSATTDATGTATVTLTPTTIGAIPVAASFIAAGSYLGSSVSLFVNVVRDESAIAYTGNAAVANGTAQTLSALLTDPDGGAPLANRTITFTIGAVSATAVTDAAGVASTSVTIPASLGTGPIRLNVSFAGDATNVPASTSVPVILYAPEAFVIWGGNAVKPRVGDHVNFWGSQWDKQVTGGDYDPNAQFKGWATPVNSPLVVCKATQHADGTCWSSKPGQSSPPATLERYISVIVSTSIAENGSSIDGNIAAVVVVRVDPVPVYGNDPGKPGFGTIVGVVADGATLFGSAAPRPAASAFFFRHIGHTRATPVTQWVSLLQPDLETITASTLFASILNPAPLTVASGTKRYSFYTPELGLMAETALQANGAPPVVYEYVWFNGHPVAQIDTATSAIHWTFTDHLGTPLLLTNADGTIYWRAEYDPYGSVFALRSADAHQPLRLPGQEAEQLNLGANGVTEREYNVFRWYRGGWGRYTQADPMGLAGGLDLYQYAMQNPISYTDRNGLSAAGALNTLNDLRRWFGGDLPPASAADPSSSQDLANSPVMDEIRQKFKGAGCKSGRYYGDFQYRQLGTTGTVTGQLVGSFGADIRRIRGCTVVIKAFNTWGTESGSRWPALPYMGSNRANPTVWDMAFNGAAITWPRSTFPNMPPGNPMQNATINYIWTEELCCCGTTP